MKHEKKELRKTVAIITVIVFILFSFSFALVPLYNTLCRTTGLNGRVNLTIANKGLINYRS